MYRTDRAGHDPEFKENDSRTRNNLEHKHIVGDGSDFVFYSSTAILTLILCVILWSLLRGF
jgi:hypothetical protein